MSSKYESHPILYQCSNNWLYELYCFKNWGLDQQICLFSSLQFSTVSASPPEVCILKQSGFFRWKVPYAYIYAIHLTYRIPYVVLIVHVKIEQHYNTYRILRIITSIFYKGSGFSHKHQVRNSKQGTLKCLVWLEWSYLGGLAIP